MPHVLSSTMFCITVYTIFQKSNLTYVNPPRDNTSLSEYQPLFAPSEQYKLDSLDPDRPQSCKH